MARTRMNKNRGEEHLATRLLWIPILLIPSIAAILLLLSNRSPWTNSGRFYTFVSSERATVQIIVQIISQTFGALNIYVLCCLVNYGTRLRLAKVPHTLDQLQFWSAMSLQRVDWALPMKFMAVLMVFNAIILVPGAIWAGALTPVFTSTLLSSTSLLQVPQYGPASNSTWGGLTWLSPMPSVHNSKGIFTYSPNYDLLGSILTQAASASKIDDRNQTVRKLDNTGYTYAGRSYGVGSSVGLVDEVFANDRTRGYNYTEYGYLSQVQCTVNATSSWALSPPVYSSNNGAPSVYWATGELANGNSEGYAVCGFDSGRDIVALVGGTSQNESVFAFATIGARSNYAALDKMQCKVDFVPTKFSISVNRTGRLITAREIKNQGPGLKDIDPTGRMKAITMRMPTSFSQQHACDLYTSLLGNTFMQNIQALTNDTSGSRNTQYTLDQRIRGVEDSLTSMLDSSLLAFSSAQLMISRDTYNAPVSISASAVRIGQSSYIYAIAAINFALVLLSLVELVRTKAWKGLSRFNFTDVRSLVVGAAMGGSSIVEEAERVHCSRDAGCAPDKPDIGGIRVRLESSEAELSVAEPLMSGPAGFGKPAETTIKEKTDCESHLKIAYLRAWK